MKFRHTNRRNLPLLNTTATADISFMLLIFFLLTSSMDVDKGLHNQMPATQEQTIVVDVAKENLMQLELTADNQLRVDEKDVDSEALAPMLTQFILQRGANHLITLSSDPAASYAAYFSLQSSLHRAYQQARMEKARQLFHAPLGDCSNTQLQTIHQAIPYRVTELSSTTKGGAQ